MCEYLYFLLFLIYMYTSIYFSPLQCINMENEFHFKNKARKADRLYWEDKLGSAANLYAISPTLNSYKVSNLLLSQCSLRCSSATLILPTLASDEQWQKNMWLLWASGNLQPLEGVGEGC